MRFIRILVINIAVIAVVLVGMDVIGWTFFKKEISLIFRDFGQTKLADRGYPRFHFRGDESLGFDISAGMEAMAVGHPAEIDSYAVWGNEYGCFDSSWGAIDSAPMAKSIYLAGDSFTWGYTAQESKFGTLLENSLGIPVMACGVSHTGQAHQFGKFKSLYEQGIRPATVIVNVTDNDIANDYFFPHTAIVEGYMVENVGWCVAEPSMSVAELGEDDIQVTHYSEDQLKQDMENFRQGSLVSSLETMSLSFNVAEGFWHRFKSWFEGTVLKQKYKNNAIVCPNIFRSVYGKGRYTIGEIVAAQGYMSSPFATANRQTMASWVEHAERHGYRLQFAMIPEKQSRPSMRQLREEKASYIKSLGAEVWSFDNYIEQKQLSYAEMYFQHDAHLNAEGNARYADFLGAKLTAEQSVPQKLSQTPVSHQQSSLQ